MSSLLAASCGDTVKLFDVSVNSGDPCTLSYTPSGSQVNSVCWNHTNLVVASAGDDKKISLWRKNGQSMGTIPVAGSDSGDNIEESFLTINFSNRTSRYICSGGSGQVVRIWDLQRKRCIKWLRGPSDTITGAMYNCKDEHLASVSLNGDVIIHNLTSGAIASELKDPNGQVLRVLDYSRISRHLLVTAGDDGSVHLWDTTGRSPKISWLNKHTAPIAGVSFSPCSDKVIASVGLDKKLYTFDSGKKGHSYCIPYESPFSSVAFNDDGYTLAAGTSSGRVVFYDVRAKPKPFTVLLSYGNSKAVTSLCWQRSNPVLVNEKNCTDDTALLGDAVEESIVMPDPLPSVTSSSLGSMSSIHDVSAAEETPVRSKLWTGGSLPKLHPPRIYKDDMDVFSPLVEVQAMTPSLGKLWDQRDGTKKDHDKNSFPFPSSMRFTLPEDGGNVPHPIFDWKSSTISKQDDDTRFSSSSFPQLESTPSPSSRSEDSSSITPPEAWGGEKKTDKFKYELGKSTSLSSGSIISSSINVANLRSRENSSNHDIALQKKVPFSSTSLAIGAKGIAGQTTTDSLGPSFTGPKRFSSYAERISTTPSFNDGISLSVGSPKNKKTGAESREELLNSLLRRSEGGSTQPQRTPFQPDSERVTSSFTLQLFQGTLLETLASFQKSIHEDMRNLHIEVLRQSHMQEMQMSNVMSAILENQAELMKEIQTLRKENRQLRQLL